MAAGLARRVLITGAGRRIGAAIARALAQDGWHVVLHHNAAGAEAAALAAELRAAGCGCDTLQADLSRRADVEGLVSRAGPLHALINNAARFFFDDIGSVDWDSLEAHLRPNLIAPVLLCRAFAEQAPPPGGEFGGGCIVNLLDQKLRNLNPDFLSYTLGKIAMGGLTEMLAIAFAGRIRVNAVAPGLTLISGRQSEESFQRAWRAPPLGRSSTPGEIAACVRFLLATPSVTGQTITLDGGESLRPRARDVAFETGE